jgi:hypothetical protein
MRELFRPKKNFQRGSQFVPAFGHAVPITFAIHVLHSFGAKEVFTFT